MKGIIVHPNSSGTIIINCPGYNGDIDGFKGKYVKIAELLSSKGIGAVVRTHNQPESEDDYEQWIKRHLKQVIQYSLDNANEICGVANPRLYLTGISAGGGAVAALAHEYPQVEKILLIAPAMNAGINAVRKGLSQYVGEIYITAGQNDEVIDSVVCEWFSAMARKAKVKKLIVVPDCDHQFRGEKNGRIFSKAPFWAFAGDDSYPSPEGGTKLYD